MIRAARGALFSILILASTPIGASQSICIVMDVGKDPEISTDLHNRFLDSSSHYCYLYSIILFGNVKSFFHGFVVDVCAEFCPALDAKDIIVYNHAEDEERMSNPREYFFEILLVHPNNVNGLSNNLSAGMDWLSWKPLAYYGSNQIPLVFRERELKSFQRGYVSHVASWGQTVIFNRKGSEGRGVLLQKMQIFWSDGNMGAQLPLRSFFGTSDEAVRRSPKQPCSESENHREDCNDALGIGPFPDHTPRKRAPFLPVFICGALAFLVGMFGGKYIDDIGMRLSKNPRGKRQGVALRLIALLIVGAGCFSFVFGLPWVMIF